MCVQHIQTYKTVTYLARTRAQLPMMTNKSAGTKNGTDPEMGTENLGKGPALTTGDSEHGVSRFTHRQHVLLRGAVW